MSRNFFQIHFRELLFFITAFIVFTPIGTLSHEYGHVLAAKSLGYQTKLHYGSMNWNAEATKKQLEVLYLENEDDILNNQDFADKKKMEQIAADLKSDSLLINSAGPIQTMLTGVIGLVFLVFRRKKMDHNGLKLLDWLGVFLSLFWLREVFNLCNSVSKKLFGNAQSYFGGDEAIISLMLQFPKGTLPVLCAALGLLVFVYVLFKIIPIEKRLTFILGGLVGGFTGLYIWMRWLGPIVLP